MTQSEQLTHQVVSIRTRPEGRVKPRRTRQCHRPKARFNPHPARRPGETSGGGECACGHDRFNPHPARRPGETTITHAYASPAPCFNPHPARRPGETWDFIRDGFAWVFVSIRTRPEGRVKRAMAPTSRSACSCFNPHPARRPGETPMITRLKAVYDPFQSAPGPKAG